MRIFLDTANIEQIRQGVRWGVVSGVTTNPTLVASEGQKNYKAVVKKICGIVDGPVSAEVTVEGIEAMLAQARDIAAWHKNVVVKIPATTEGLEVTSKLAKEGIKVNMTLCFSANQALLGALAGAAFISPFVGRLDDIGQDGMALVRDIMDIYKEYDFDTEVIAASIRHPLHCVAAAQAGADIATVPFKVLEQMMKHPLTEAGNARFLADWRRVSGKT
ncbi:MAG: fructose-6-phosphate aldolase [Dehalococcoidia bacterium]|nr:MAG: fructose-6-phosphate aldolase [Dehalococcoidia bacterium]